MDLNQEGRLDQRAELGQAVAFDRGVDLDQQEDLGQAEDQGQDLDQRAELGRAVASLVWELAVAFDRTAVSVCAGDQPAGRRRAPDQHRVLVWYLARDLYHLGPVMERGRPPGSGLFARLGPVVVALGRRTV